MTTILTKLLHRGLCRILRLAPVGALVSAPLRAATSDYPKPEALLQRHIDAIGGAAALRQANGLAFKGEVALPFVKAQAPIEFLFQPPDRFYCWFRYHHAFFGFLKVPFVAKRTAECGYDGTNGWMVDFEHNVEPLYGSDEAFMRGLLDKFSPLCFGRSFPLTRTLDITRFADRDCYRVLIVFPFGEHAFEYYDLQNGLLVGTIYPFEADDALLNIRTVYEDFRSVGGGLRLPFRMEVQVGNQLYSIQATEVRTDLAGARVPGSKYRSPPKPLPCLKPASIPGRDVIERYLAASGGADALRRHRSLHLSGSYEIPGAHGFTNRLEIFSALTNRLYFTLPTPKGLYREGCDGEHCWKVDIKDIKLAEGKELEQKLLERQFLSDLHAPESFRSIETVGTINLDDHECYQLLLIRQNGEVLDEFYDVRTGLLRGRNTADERTGGAINLLARFEGYRLFGDWRLPTRQSYRLTGDAQVVAITNAEWDTTPAAVFEMPAEVKARLGRSQ